MKLSIQAGATSQTVNIFIQDSSSTTGQGLAGLVFNSSGLTAYYALPRAASNAITLATLAAVTSSYSSGGFKEIDPTNMKGWYRFDIPDAALASGRFTSIHLFGATNMAPLPIEIELTGWNNQDAVRGGMTALPNANAEAAGGLYTKGTGAGQINQSANGQIDVNVQRLNNVAQSLLDLVDFSDTGYDPATHKVQGVVTTDTATVTGSVTGNVGGNVAGSVGSVTGNVGGNVVGTVASVVGNVGGNVVGTVASVVGNVGGNVTGSVGSVVADVGITQAGADKVFGASGAAMAELGAVPSATPSPRNAMMLLFMALRNKLTTTASEKKVYNDAGSAIGTKALTDDGTTYTEAEMA